MAITAADVNKLRKQTGLGLMDCKKALVETDGDFEKAIELLRKKGQKIAAKRGDNDASEGYVIAKTTEDGKTGINLVLNCETDFVAKNQQFIDFVEGLADLALSKMPGSKDDLNNTDWNGRSVSEVIQEQMGKIGEKLEVSDYGILSSEKVVAYNHPGNRTAAIVALSKDNADVGRDIAMQVAAMSPIALDESEVSEEVKQKEIEIGTEQAIAEGKPAEMAGKIAQGKLGKFLKERTLLNQEFIKTPKKSVKQYLKEVDGDLQVKGFKLITLS